MKRMIHLKRETDHLEDAVLFIETGWGKREQEVEELISDGWRITGEYLVTFITGSAILPSDIGID